MERRLAEAIEALTAAQRSCDWFIFRLFLITGTTAQSMAKEERLCRGVLCQNSARARPEATEESLGKRIARCWTTSLRNSGGEKTLAMRVGSVNEAGIAAELKQQVFCKELFEVGLVRSKKYTVLGASADNVAVVERPGGHNSGGAQGARFVTVPVEIKTMCNEQRLAMAAKSFGSCFSCTAGDATWWEVVPQEYRGQVIHQAVVFDCGFTLFCIGFVTNISHTVLVRVPHQLRECWGEAVTRIAGLYCNWAWNALRNDEIGRAHV